MIKTKEDLRRVLSADAKYYLRNTFRKRLLDNIFCRERIIIWRYVQVMRYCEYYTNNKKKSFIHSFLYWWYLRKHNKNCVKYGLLIGASAFQEGLCIYHLGNIVVNGYCKIGKNCKLHGSNCIGNSRLKDDCPVIGDNVRLGVGAKVFGNVFIANNVTIAAGAVVNKSCYEDGATLAGVPAKIVKHGTSKTENISNNTDL